MAVSSVPRGSIKHEPLLTRSIVADVSFCAQVAECIGIPSEASRKAFYGEPVEEVLGMVRWTLGKQSEQGRDFDTKSVLLAWAQKRGRGAWSTRKKRLGAGESEYTKRELVVEVARYWIEHPEELVKALVRTSEPASRSNEDVSFRRNTEAGEGTR